MGACYDVTFTLRICNHNAAVDVMKKYILNAPNVDFSLEDYKKDGVGLESLSDLMRIILAGRKSSNFCEKVTTAGSLIYTNCFEASYVSNVPEKTLPIFAPPYYLIWRLYHKKEVNLIE